MAQILHSDIRVKFSGTPSGEQCLWLQQRFGTAMPVCTCASGDEKCGSLSAFVCLNFRLSDRSAPRGWEVGDEAR